MFLNTFYTKTTLPQCLLPNKELFAKKLFVKDPKESVYLKKFPYKWVALYCYLENKH